MDSFVGNLISSTFCLKFILILLIFSGAFNPEDHLYIPIQIHSNYSYSKQTVSLLIGKVQLARLPHRFVKPSREGGCGKSEKKTTKNSSEEKLAYATREWRKWGDGAHSGDQQGNYST